MVHKPSQDLSPLPEGPNVLAQPGAPQPAHSPPSGSGTSGPVAPRQDQLPTSLPSQPSDAASFSDSGEAAFSNPDELLLLHQRYSPGSSLLASQAAPQAQANVHTN